MGKSKLRAVRGCVCDLELIKKHEIPPPSTCCHGNWGQYQDSLSLVFVSPFPNGSAPVEKACVLTCSMPWLATWPTGFFLVHHCQGLRVKDLVWSQSKQQLRDTQQLASGSDDSGALLDNPSYPQRSLPGSVKTITNIRAMLWGLTGTFT